MSHLIITTATIDDIPAIQRIAYKTWPVAYGSILSKEQIEYMLDEMYDKVSLTQQLNSSHQFFIAHKGGEAIGFASVSKEDGFFKLNKLYVLPAMQNTGAGKKLLHAVIEYVQKHGGIKLLLQVNRNNPAVSFYNKMGFVILYEFNFDIGNDYFMNDYMMEKIIG